MKEAHKAIMARAAKEGLLPSELAAELVVHDLVNATRAQMSRYEVGYNKMTEKQQDAVLAELQENFKGTSEIIGRILASAGTASVRMTCKDMKISNGTLTGIVSSDEQHFNALISKVQDKSEVLVVLYEREYSEALDGIQSEKDQKALPFDDEPAKGAKADKTPRVSSPTSAATLAKKATELSPKLLQDARDFITNQQVCTVSGIQNGLKIGAVKATAVLDQMAEEGLVEFVGDSKSGEYKLKRAKSAPTDETVKTGSHSDDDTDLAPTDSGLSFDGVDDDVVVAELNDALYEKIKAKVLADKKVSIGAISVGLDIDTFIVEQGIERLEADGLVTAENDMGIRSVVEAE